MPPNIKNKKIDANIRDKNKHYIEDQKSNNFIKKIQKTTDQNHLVQNKIKHI